jgi:multiple sugar transport system substrate-binding protein
MNRRRFLQVSGLMGAGYALASCGGAGSASDEGASDDTSGRLSGGQIAGDITYWHYMAEQTANDALDVAIDEFESLHSGVQVQAEGIPLGDYFAKVVTATQSSALPQTGMVVLGTLADTVAMGSLLDLTQQIQDWDKFESIPKSLWDEATIDGKLYGIPMFAFVGWLYYRKDWLDEAGLEPPGTWQEFEEVAIALTDPAQDRYGFGMRGGVGGGYDLTNVIESFGGVMVDENGSPALERDVLVEALGFYSGLHTRHNAVPPSVADDSFQQLMTAFKTGQTGMLAHHTGSLIEISDALEPDQFATVPMPSGPGGTASRVSGQLNAIMSEDNFDTSWAWITQWAEPETQLAFHQAVGHHPSTLEAAQDPIVAENPVYATAVEIFGSAPAATSFIGLSAWQNEHLLPAFQRILIGDATVEAAADDILAGLDQVVS